MFVISGFSHFAIWAVVVYFPPVLDGRTLRNTCCIPAQFILLGPGSLSHVAECLHVAVLFWFEDAENTLKKSLPFCWRSCL